MSKIFRVASALKRLYEYYSLGTDFDDIWGMPIREKVEEELANCNVTIDDVRDEYEEFKDFLLYMGE
jgi:hypothetical protein